MGQLPNSELKKFSDYLRSPLFNSNKKLIDLFDLYLEHGDSSNVSLLSGLKSCGHHGLSEATIIKLKNRLVEHLFDYFELESFRNRNISRKSYLLRYFIRFDLLKYFEFYRNKGLKNLKQELWGVNEFAENFAISMENVVYETDKSIRSQESTSSLISALESLDQMYLAQRLKLQVALRNHLGIIGGQEPQLIELDLNQLEEERAGGPVLPVYILMLIRLFKSFDLQGSSGYFHDIMGELTNPNLDISIPDKKDFFKTLINISIKQVHIGEKEYLNYIFELYEEMRHQDLLLDEDGTLSPYHLKNIMKSALLLEKTDWGENFLVSMRPFFPENRAEIMYRYHLGLLRFHEKKYESTIKEMEYDKEQDEKFDLFYSCDSRVLLLKALYFMRDHPYRYDEMERLCISFNGYLKRHRKEIAPQHSQRYKSFVKNFKKMVTTDQVEDWKNIMVSVDSESLIAEKNWLSEQLTKRINTRKY